MARIKNLFVFFLLKSKYENRHPLKEFKKKENQLTKQAALFHSLQDALMMW